MINYMSDKTQEYNSIPAFPTWGSPNLLLVPIDVFSCVTTEDGTESSDAEIGSDGCEAGSKADRRIGISLLN
jgi:hypothetical protein